MATSLPIEKQLVEVEDESGKILKFAALDKKWVLDFYGETLPRYRQIFKFDEVAKKEWLEDMEGQIDICTWLMSLEFRKFWSQVIYGMPDLSEMLETYLENCPRRMNPGQMAVTFFSSDATIADAQQTLHRCIFAILGRLLKSRESEKLYMEADYHAKLLPRWFDLPMLIDLCSVYGLDNKKVVTEMIQSLLKKRPKFLSEMKTLCDGLDERLSHVAYQIQRFLQKKQQIQGVLNNEMTSYYQDFVLYIGDFMFSVELFLDCVPQARSVFHEQGFTAKLPSLFESTLGVLCRELGSICRGDLDGISPGSLKERLTFAAEHWVSVFRRLLEYNCINVLLKSGERNERIDDFEKTFADYFELMTGLSADKKFFAAYESCFPFQQDCDVFMEHSLPVPLEQLSYIAQTIGEVCSSKPSNQPKSVLLPQSSKKSNNTKPNKMEPDFGTTSSSGASGTSSVSKSAEVDLKAKMVAVKEVFDDMSDSLIEKCLIYFNYSAEQVIDARLCGNMPPHLTADDSSNDSEVASASSSVAANAALNNDGNVNSDGFERKPLEKLQSGKRRGVTKDLLDDKSDLAELISKDFYRRHQFETPESGEEDSLYGSDDEAVERRLRREIVIRPLNDPDLSLTAGYEDEYDDAYDSNNVGAQDADSADEVTSATNILDPSSKAQTSSAIAVSSSKDKHYNGEAVKKGGQQQPGARAAHAQQPPNHAKSGRQQTQRVPQNQRGVNFEDRSHDFKRPFQRPRERDDHSNNGYGDRNQHQTVATGGARNRPAAVSNDVRQQFANARPGGRNSGIQHAPRVQHQLNQDDYCAEENTEKEQKKALPRGPGIGGPPPRRGGAGSARPPETDHRDKTGPMNPPNPRNQKQFHENQEASSEESEDDDKQQGGAQKRGGGQGQQQNQGYTGGRDRAWQDRHRQQTKHHNRKAGADRKMRSGY